MEKKKSVWWRIRVYGVTGGKFYQSGQEVCQEEEYLSRDLNCKEEADMGRSGERGKSALQQKSLMKNPVYQGSPEKWNEWEIDKQTHVHTDEHRHKPV